MAATTVEDIQARLLELHAEENGAAIEGEAGFDWMSILMDLLMGLLGGCVQSRTPKQIVDYAKQKPLRTRLLLLAAMADKGIRPTYRPVALRTLMRAAQEATPAHVAALVAPIDEDDA